ncbi:MAG: DUF438 domain-containing protein [Chloroflexi bacterium]|nr:DUF438 domain-containing protein [Chloroflexota bacterium]
MTAIKTIDVKGLGHAEKESLIFPGIEALKPGETLRITVEFNPVPLVYMLKAQDKYDISFDKEGPDEWILVVRHKVPGEEDKKRQLKKLIGELGKGEVSDETKGKAKELLGSVDATTLGLLEQELIREGVSHDVIRSSLCDIHLESMRDALISKRVEVKAPHPIHTLMEEHKRIVQDLKDLSELTKDIANTNDYDSFDSYREKLTGISHHLVEAEKHHQREEETLFPRLEKHDVVEPPAIMKMDHVDLRPRKQELHRLASDTSREVPFPKYKAHIVELGEYIAKELESHIFKEDNILYQIALQVFTPEEWESVKRECDKIGYCCFTPEGHLKEEDTMETAIVDLDLRQIPIWDRHDNIFQEWDALQPGQTLRITNDHDPKPLHYQFEAEYKGHYEWQYEQKGPKDWIVSIKKL